MAEMMRVRAQLTGFVGSPGLATFYFVGSNPATAPEALEASSRVRALFESFKAHLPSTEQVVYSSQVDVLDPSTGTLSGGLSVALPVTTTGTGGGNYISTASTYLGQLITTSIINGRRVRGRTNIGVPLASDNGATGVPVVAAVGALNTALALLGTTIVTPIVHVVWHRPKNHAGGAAVAVTGYSTSTKWAVLRSRRD